MPKNKLLIRGGCIVDPANGIEGYKDLLIADGKIEAIGDNIPPIRDNCTIINAINKYVIPGLIDCHVHLREPGLEYKENIGTGTRAAVKGGYTTVICEPNTIPPIDSPEMVNVLMERVLAKSLVNVYTKACITKGQAGYELTDIPALVKDKRVRALSDDGNPVIYKGLMGKACELSAQNNFIISPHCEDSPAFLDRIKENPSMPHFPGEPYTHETDFVKRDISCCERVKGRLHISHVSLKSTLDVVQMAKERHMGKITCEATPHHVLLDINDKNSNTCVPGTNPPLRSREDREAIQRGLINGVIDVIATDHAPHTNEDLEKGATGAIGLETALGVILTKFVHTGILSLKDVVRKMSTNPAQIFQIEGGSLTVGKAANITIIDMNREWIVDVDEFESMGRNCPFHGWKLTGQVATTIVNGKAIVDEYKIKC